MKERRGGAGLYIKALIEQKVRHDLNKIDESTEHFRKTDMNIKA